MNCGFTTRICTCAMMHTHKHISVDVMPCSFQAHQKYYQKVTSLSRVTSCNSTGMQLKHNIIKRNELKQMAAFKDRCMCRDKWEYRRAKLARKLDRLRSNEQNYCTYFCRNPYVHLSHLCYYLYRWEIIEEKYSRLGSRVNISISEVLRHGELWMKVTIATLRLIRETLSM